MKKKFFFILLIIIIIIIFSYNYCYEHFSVKVQDAMIFKDYRDKLVGTYPDKNIYPDFFIKSNGEYVNMIGTVHGVSEIKIPKPKDGKKGPKGEQGNQGNRGPEGPRGKHGEELAEEDVVNNRNSTCIAPGGISISTMCKGPDGDSPTAPPDGTPGQRCPHPGGHFVEENGHQVYYGGKCPDGTNGDPGRTCLQEYGIEAGHCPREESKHGPPGFTCEKVNRDAGIVVGPDASGVMRKCPDGEKGLDGDTCAEVHEDLNIGSDNRCPVPDNGNNGLSCYEVYKNTLPECTESTPGVNSVDCINPDTPNVKTCGVINPDKPSDVANNLSINGNTLTINNNKAITFRGNKITLPTNGNIVLKDANNNIIKTINKSYIDDMILKSQQCKKCPDQGGKKRWNNSTNCQVDQGECKECKECESGYYVQQSCSQHSNTKCKQCEPGYVGIGCRTKCDPIKGEIPRDDKTACKTIGSNKYIHPNDNTKEKNIPSNKYRNPNDARLLNDIPSNKYRDRNSNTLNDCPSTSCGAGEHLTGSCGGSTINTRFCKQNVCRCDHGTAVKGAACSTHNKHKCASCSSAYRLKSETCQPYILLWDFNNQMDGGDPDWGGGSKEAIGHNPWIGSAINDDVSSISNPHGHPFSLYEHSNYGGGCVNWNTSVPRFSWTTPGYNHYFVWNGTDRSIQDQVSSYKIGSWCP
tara:strand:+ start:9986 stop:12061 length:2076 start_codon:yes stop_codon:yes gene_type:complete